MDSQTKETNENYSFFKKQLPNILQDHFNEYALLKNKKIIQFFSTYSDANKYGDAVFKDKLYSIQKVTQEIINLGFYSYA